MVISFCTVCRNRAEHYKQTILQNLKDTETENDIEFVILDYNSEDDLEVWVRDQLHNYIEEGRLVYYRTNDPLFFHRSHSRNMLFKLAKGDWMCNVDADNFIGAGFTGFLKKEILKDNNIFLCAGGMDDQIHCSDIGGRICFSASDFFAVGGYDEVMSGYGFEDYDLINRLEFLNLNKILIKERQFLQVIGHNHYDRIKEEFSYKNMKMVGVVHLNPSESILLFLLLNDTFILGNVCSNREDDPDCHENSFFGNTLGHGVRLSDGKWISGNVSGNTIDGQRLLSHDSSTVYILEFTAVSVLQLLIIDGIRHNVYEIEDKDLIKEAIFFNSKTSNRLKLEINHSKRILKPNEKSFGTGTVYKNFDYDMPIVLE